MAKRPRVPLLLVLVAATVVLAWFSVRWTRRQLDLDACVDSGGWWDAAHDRCSNVQADCQPRR
jgi:hypothetical protein